MMSYNPFWKTLKEKGFSQYKLIHEHRISTGTLANMRKNKPLETTTIERFCEILKCEVQDIIKYSPEEK